MLTNGPITIYNMYYEPIDGVNLYYKTIISAAWFFGKVKSAVAENGIIAAEEYTARIPMHRLNAGGKKYISAREYQKLPMDQVQNYFTFANGDKFLHGAVEFEVQPGVAGYSIADLEKRYEHVATITGHNIRLSGDERFHSLTGN